MSLTISIPSDAKITDRRRYLHFYAEDFSNAQLNGTFDVLSGDQPPTVTDGYAQWGQVQRPLRIGLIVYTGRNPISMQVSCRFMLFDKHGGWLTDDDAGLGVEEQIRLLEWMAGQTAVTGPSPRVWVTTYDAHGQTAPLVPFIYQGASASTPKFFAGGTETPWVITALSWDTAPVRNRAGYRVRQDATVTLTYYLPPQGSKTDNSPRPKGITVRSKPGADTALEIARNVPGFIPQALATAIVQAPQNSKLRLRGVNQKIKHGKKVFVPASKSV